jgi:hypothetical protein
MAAVNEKDVADIMGGVAGATGGDGGGVRLNDARRKLRNRFEICRKLGQGTYGKVQLGINKETGQEVSKQPHSHVAQFQLAYELSLFRLM